MKYTYEVTVNIPFTYICKSPTRQEAIHEAMNMAIEEIESGTVGIVEPILSKAIKIK